MPRKKRVVKPAPLEMFSGSSVAPVPSAVPGMYVFNPLSLDSQFATLHSTLIANSTRQSERMDSQDSLLQEIKAETSKTNGRVTGIEKKWEGALGFVKGAKWTAALAATVATAAVNLLFRLLPH